MYFKNVKEQYIYFKIYVYNTFFFCITHDN